MNFPAPRQALRIPGIRMGHILAGLGAPPQSQEEALAQFKQNYVTLRAQIQAANYSVDPPVIPTATLNNNLASLDRVYDKAVKGDWQSAATVSATARKMLDAINAGTESKMDAATEVILQSLTNLPVVMHDIVVGTAKTAGDAARAFGIDPAATISGTQDALKYVGAGIGLLAAAFIISKLT